MLNKGHVLDGKYEIIKVLGQGGMGTVYLCKNSRLENLWAVKEVNSQYANQIDLLAEPNILKNLSHTGIVRIVDIFHEEDNLYIIEDYIEGKTLKEHVDANGPLSSERVEDLSLQLCSILDYLHSFNLPIIYRDLKPSNIMIKPDGKLVLIDFGTARTYKADQDGDTMILGSMGYIAPEQLVNAQSNAQTDLYSLGATMFFMLTGKSKCLPAEIMLSANYPEQTSKNVIKVIQKASASEPENRYRDVKMMMFDLSANSSDEEYDKTMLMSSSEVFGETTQTIQVEKKEHKKTKSIPIPLLVSLMIFAIFFAMLINNSVSDAKAPEPSVPAKTVEKTEPKVQPVKEVVEQDTFVNGIIDINNPIRSSPADSDPKVKGKKNKERDLQFVLNPAAAVSNSKLSVSLISIERAGRDDAIAVLTIRNIADAALKLDLSKTYLINGEDEAANVDYPDSDSLVSIAQSADCQEFELHFKNFDFEGSSYILKTVLSSEESKDIDLHVDIEGLSEDD